MLESWDPQEDAWLAGFTAGEACFRIDVQGRSGAYRGFRPGFTIELRADEAAILYRLRDAFGGVVAVRPHQQGGDARPTLSWRVDAKESLAALVAYFERFPLRAKKHAEFIVWAEAVRIYVASNYRAQGLDVLSGDLKALRKYRPPVLESLTPPTRRDVARLAGVSERTVKRVVSHDEHPVAAETEKRVREAMATLGYVGGGRQKPRLRLVA